MILVFNKAGFVIGGATIFASFAAAQALGWFDKSGAGPPQAHYFVLLWGALMGMIDLVYRLRNVGEIFVPPPPKIITRAGPVPSRPEPVTKLLNLLLSGEYGAQFFWVIPAWVLGVSLVYLSMTVLKMK
jgi:hypothetical protein